MSQFQQRSRLAKGYHNAKHEADGSLWPLRWDKKGHLYFLTMGNRLMEADLETGGASLQVKAIHPLFQLSLPSFSDPLFDVSSDGSRFLVVTSADPNASKSIGLLLDWQSKLTGKE